MKKFHPFYLIGTLGVIITAILHIVMALSLSLTNVHKVFFAIYPTFPILLIVGVALTIKQQKESANS